MVATVIAPPIFVSIVCPGWFQAVQDAGLKPNLIMMACGFCWGMGAITYAYGFNILGMALAAAMIKGISIAVGSGYALAKDIEKVADLSFGITLVGLAILLIGTGLGGKAGMMREKEVGEEGAGEGSESSDAPKTRTARMFTIGMISCLVSGIFSAGVALGWTEGEPVDEAMRAIAGAELPVWQAEFVRWMPIYFGGFLSILIFMGGEMIRSGDWKRYGSQGSGRDFMIASSMGVVHFCAHLTFGMSTYFLGAALGNSVGFALHIALALLVAAGIGFYNREWAGASKKAISWIGASIIVLIIAVGVLAYGTYVQETIVQSASETSASEEVPSEEAQASAAAQTPSEQ